MQHSPHTALLLSIMFLLQLLFSWMLLVKRNTSCCCVTSSDSFTHSCITSFLSHLQTRTAQAHVTVLTVTTTSPCVEARLWRCGLSTASLREMGLSRCLSAVVSAEPQRHLCFVSAAAPNTSQRTSFDYMWHINLTDWQAGCEVGSTLVVTARLG